LPWSWPSLWSTAAEEETLRHRLMHFLVQRMGFRSVAWEEDCGELQEHAPGLLASPLVGEAEEGRAVMSTINRNSGTHQPISTRQVSAVHQRRCQQSASK
jgi:hypothetical protein